MSSATLKHRSDQIAMNLRMVFNFKLALKTLSLKGGNYQDFSKWGELFLGHSLTIIKWTWGFFSKNLQVDPPTIRHKRVL